MSRRADVRLFAMGLLSWAACPAGAQTIADYSRVQRDVIEEAMTAAAARAAARAASSAGPAASAPAMPSAMAAAPPLPPPEPALRVGGLFVSASRVAAEIVVDEASYLLAVGEAVPGTPWVVDAIGGDRVVLRRAALGRDSVASRRSLPFPTLR